MARYYAGAGVNNDKDTNQIGAPRKTNSSKKKTEHPREDYWKNKHYWTLSESVRKAIDIAQNK